MQYATLGSPTTKETTSYAMEQKNIQDTLAAVLTNLQKQLKLVGMAFLEEKIW